jgi:hypothetical protein
LNKLNYILAAYIAPTLSALLGLFILVIPPFYDDNYDISKTTEISGTLNSYYSYKWGRGKSDYDIIFRLNEYSNEFEDTYLNEQLCKDYFINNKSKLTFRIDNKDKNALNEQGRIGNIGITIDNKVLQTAEQHLKKDSIVKNYLLPFLGLVLLTLSYLIHRKGRNDYVKQRQ